MQKTNKQTECLPSSCFVQSGSVPELGMHVSKQSKKLKIRQERNVLQERLVNKDDKNRHCVLLIIDISKHGAKEMGNVKMAGPGFVKDVTA
jgi:hypothetical protein